MAADGDSPSSVRRRDTKPSPNGTTTAQAPVASTKQAKSRNGVTIVDVLRILGGLVFLSSLLSYFVTSNSLTWGYRPWFTRPAVISRYLRGPVLLTDAQLNAYDGSDPSKPIYLALNGTIYDVTSGARVYGPGGGYHALAGKDASRAFITGCFGEDGTPDLRGAEWTYISTDILSPEEEAETGVKVIGEGKSAREQALRKARKQVKGTIEGWASMFRGDGGKEYFAVGTVMREEGWEAKLPRRTLCEAGRKARPKPKEGGQDAGAAYRGS